MHHPKQTPVKWASDGGVSVEGLSAESCTKFTTKEWFSRAARAALIGCTLHRIELEHRTLFRLECCTKGATILSHGHDLTTVLDARGRA